MCILVSARLHATAAPDAPAPIIRTSTGSFIVVPWGLLVFFRHCEERSDEAIHSFFLRRNGLLPPSLVELRRTSRFARNDAETPQFTIRTGSERMPRMKFE